MPCGAVINDWQAAGRNPESNSSVSCIGFVLQDFGSGEATGLASVEKLLEASPVSDTANASRPLAKAESFSDGGSASGIADLRRGKSLCNVSQREE